MRAKRSALEALVAQAVVNSVKDHSPGLRDAVRDLLDKGAKPAEIRRRYGAYGRRKNSSAALAVEWLVDEWQRDKGQVKADESIDKLT